MRTRSNILITLSSQYIVMGCIFLSTVVIARNFGAKEVGYYALFRVVPNITNLLMGLGLNVAIPYLIGTKRATPSTIVNVLLTATLPLALLMTLSWLAATPMLSHLFFRELDPKIVSMACLLPGIMCVNYMMSSYTHGLQNFLVENSSRITGETTSTIFLSATFFYHDLDTSWLVLGIIVGQLTILAYNSGYLIYQGHWKPALAWDLKLFREALSYGLRARLGTIANFLNFRLDVLVVSVFLTPQIFGLYTIASKMAELLRKISYALFYVLYPKLSGKSNEEATALVMSYFGPLLAISVILGILCFFILPWLMVFCYGQEAGNATQALRIFIVGTVFFCTNGLFQSFHAGTGNPQYNSYAVMSGIPFIVIGNLTLTPVLGIEGAAISSAVAFCSIIFTNIYLFLSHSNKSFMDLLLNRNYSPEISTELSSDKIQSQ